MLAFGRDGLNIYTPADGSVIKVISNKYRGEDPRLVDEMYYPLSWSPDDSQILLGISYYESGSSGIFTLAAGTMTKLQRSDGYCACGISAWDPAGGKLVMAGFAYAANTSEIWEYSTTANSSSRLLPEKDPSGSYNYVKFPMLRNDEIYFMYVSAGDQSDDNELTRMVKAPRSDLTAMTPLRSDEQLLQEALWADDGSMVVAINAPPSFDYPLRGPLVKLTADSQPVQTLVSDAREIQWGP